MGTDLTNTLRSDRGVSLFAPSRDELNATKPILFGIPGALAVERRKDPMALWLGAVKIVLWGV